MMFEINDSENLHREEGAIIRVIGMGGAGCNAINTMIRSGLSGVEYAVANTDAQALKASLATTKIQLGVDLTKGLGAGANPEIGRKAALDDYEKLTSIIEGADMVFITAGMGGGTGTGAAPVLAKLAKDLGTLTVGVVTRPFKFEGKRRFRQAETGILELEENVDSLIVIPNQRLLHIAGEELSLIDTFKKADDVLLNAVRGISDLINHTGHINADFADVKTVMANKGMALMGAGVCSGDNRAVKAATEAISSPLLEDISIDGATGIIINITGNESLTMHETNEAVTLIMEAADDDAEIIFGTVIDEKMEEVVKVTVIATGLGEDDQFKQAHPSQHKMATMQVSQNAFDKDHSQNLSPVSKMQEEMRSTSHPSLEEKNMLKNKTITKEEERSLHNNLVNHSKGLTKNIQRATYRPDYSKDIQEQSTSFTGEDMAGSHRAKSIAEKLGFIELDEQELKNPTYLRKNKPRPSSTKENHSISDS